MKTDSNNNKPLISLWNSNRLIRRLISIEECGKIAETKKIVRKAFDFSAFIYYLISKNIIAPFTYHNKFSTDVRFNRGIYFRPNPPEDIPYFHPLQLLQMVDLYKLYFKRNFRMIEDNEFQKSVFGQKREQILKETEHQIQEETENPDNTWGTYENPKETKKDWEKKEYEPFKPSEKNIRFFRSELWLSDKELGLWMKLENIFYKSEMITSIQLQGETYFNTNRSDEKIQKYNEWRSRLNLNDEFSQEDIKLLETLLFWIKKRSNEHGMGLERNFDLIPFLSSDNFTNFIWIANLFLDVQRYLIRCLFFLTGQDYTIQKPFPGKPDFICETIPEYNQYLTQVSINHRLQLHTFKLLVEGKTEQTLIQSYINKFWNRSRAKVVNMEGIDNYVHYKIVSRQLQEPYLWYLRDYDQGQHKDKTPNMTWFHPDFITELFTPEDIIGAVRSFLMEQMNKEKLEKSLEIEMNSLKSLLNQDNSIGYEKILTKFLFDNLNLRKIFFPSKFQAWTTSYENLGKVQTFLKNCVNNKIGEHLIPYFIKTKNGKQIRNQKFDNKMEPFLKFCDNITTKNWIKSASKQNNK
jgi:hypothetical protein